ncbi:MAG TPA: hypothetical protein VK010_00790, partial [Flavobacteriaceae bacterium]|nr:hypothetical protein [Flavobacteriaceae bacterium]
MTRKNLQHIKIKPEDGRPKTEATNKLQPEPRTQNPETFSTAEEINIKKTYTKKDIENLHHLNFVAGIAPHLRGPYSTM